MQAGAALAQTRRNLSLHEHHSMELMSSFGISVPYGEVATTAEQAKDITQRLGTLAASYPWTNSDPGSLSISLRRGLSTEGTGAGWGQGTGQV